MRSLDLHVGDMLFEPSAKGPNGKPISANVKITKEAAAKIITVLAKDNFFRESVEDESQLTGPKGAYAEIWVSYQKEDPAATVQRWRKLAWGPQLVQHLEALQACVAAQSLGELLWMPRWQLPLTYRSEKTGFIFYVESDGQHMAAMNKELKLLWHRNVIVDGAQAEIISGQPTRITELRKATDATVEVAKGHGKSGEYVFIGLDNKAAGLVDQNTGEFFWLGSN